MAIGFFYYYRILSQNDFSSLSLRLKKKMVFQHTIKRGFRARHKMKFAVIHHLGRKCLCVTIDIC